MGGKTKSKFYVYILKCSDRTYYTGYTNDLEKRLACHNSGLGAKYTRGRLPVKMLWSKECESKGHAMSQEFKIKKLSRKEKENLIRG